jgi:hypothetical protein
MLNNVIEINIKNINNNVNNAIKDTNIDIKEDNNDIKDNINCGYYMLIIDFVCFIYVCFK